MLNSGNVFFSHPWQDYKKKIGWIFINVHLAEWQSLAINFIIINLLFPGVCTLLGRHKTLNPIVALRKSLFSHLRYKCMCSGLLDIVSIDFWLLWWHWESKVCTNMKAESNLQSQMLSAWMPIEGQTECLFRPISLCWKWFVVDA